MKSRLLKNCRILEDGKLVERHLLLEDHKVAYISDEVITADEVMDIKGNVVIPGLIDCHVHFREPGMTHKEDFLSGGIAAAKGGVTTILDMPNTMPPTVSVVNLEEKRKLAEKCIVNYGFHFGSTSDNLNEIKNATSIASVKIFMDVSTGNLRIENMETVEKIMKTAKLCTVHAEEGNFEITQKIWDDLYQNWMPDNIQNRGLLLSHLFTTKLCISEWDQALAHLKMLWGLVKSSSEIQRHESALWDSWMCCLLVLWFFAKNSKEFYVYFMKKNQMQSALYLFQRKSIILEHLDNQFFVQLLSKPYYQKARENNPSLPEI